MNGKQQEVLNQLLADFASKRGFSEVGYEIINPGDVQTVANYVIKPDSVLIAFDLPNFPPIELTASGSRPGVLPTISTYNEFNREANSYQPFPNGRTTYDALLFADSHATKVRRERTTKTAKNTVRSVRQSDGQIPRGELDSDPYNFVLQFPPSEIAGLVARRERNVEQDDAFEAGRRIRGGDYSRQNLEVIVAWKMEGVHLTRVMSYLGQNTDAEIDQALRSAAATDDERSAIEILDRLHGVGVPVASAILTTILPQKYTIIDVNALVSLGVGDKLKGQSVYYLAYLKKCRELAAQLNVSLRTMDHALWQWGYEN
ncbi:MAG TPA: hypothetical protein VK302_20640 [Terriglobales bacterium]|nr:hypothetical protein [Terriglobales bacterium]